MIVYHLLHPSEISRLFDSIVSACLNAGSTGVHSISTRAAAAAVAALRWHKAEQQASTCGA